MTATWAVKDASGDIVSGLTSGSRNALGRKLLPTPFDAFRLEVSASYREAFDRALTQVLRRQGWELIRLDESGLSGAN